MIQATLLFFYQGLPQQPTLLNELHLENFASVFEVFMGIGFAFFVLTKIDDFLNSMLGVGANTDEAIMATIDSFVELTQELINEARAKDEGEIALDLSEHESDLVKLKIKIAEERFRIIYNSRFYFLLLGFHALTLLIFSGLEEYCIHPSSEYKACFYSALLCANIFFILANILLIFFIFQNRRDEPIILKTLLLLAMLVICIGIGIFAEFNFMPVGMLIGMSILSIALPFALLLNRRAKFKYTMRKQDFEGQVEDIRYNIGRAKIKLNNIQAV